MHLPPFFVPQVEFRVFTGKSKSFGGPLLDSNILKEFVCVCLGLIYFVWRQQGHLSVRPPPYPVSRGCIIHKMCQRDTANATNCQNWKNALPSLCIQRHIFTITSCTSHGRVRARACGCGGTLSVCVCLSDVPFHLSVCPYWKPKPVKRSDLKRFPPFCRNDLQSVLWLDLQPLTYPFVDCRKGAVKVPAVFSGLKKPCI